VDVNIYASGDNTVIAKLRGNHENTEISQVIQEYLELDLEPITKILNSGYNVFSPMFSNFRNKEWMHGDKRELRQLQDEIPIDAGGVLEWN